jgi:hypothetical protein
MDNIELRKLLNQLNDEIGKTQAVDETGAELLYNLKEDIDTLLSGSEEYLSKEQPKITQNLQGTLDHFEVTHPTLTTQISRLLDFLSNTGI